MVQRQLAPGVEIHVGMFRDALLGPLVVVAAGGAMVEVLQQRRVGLPPLDEAGARDLLGQPTVARLLAGLDGRREPVEGDTVVDAVLAMSQIAVELGDVLEALDVNPLVVSSEDAVAVDVLVIPR